MRALVLLAAALWTAEATADAAPSDPKCRTGILAPPSCCCAADCGVCGGESCQNHPGGGTACCCGAIAAANRSCATHDPPCVVPIGPPAPIPPPSAVVRAKRGFVADGHKGDPQTCDDPVLLNVSGWFYAYNKPNPYRASGLGGDCARANATGCLDERFAPMDWCLSGIALPTPPYVNQTFFMGFNEPNNLHNCNTEPAKAAAAWAEVEANHPHSMLVSPATSGNGIPWFDAFFSNCTHLYGAKGCKIDYLAAHDYSCDPNSTMTYLEKLYTRYGYKIWLTEFSCGDGAAGRPTEDHLRFMQGILPLLDATDHVFRYSWMSARDGAGKRGLVETVDNRTQLTVLGCMWNS